MVLQEDDWGEDDVDWGEDVSEDAVKQRLDEISGAARSMTLSDDLEKTQSERVNIFYDFVKVSASLYCSRMDVRWCCIVLSLIPQSSVKENSAPVLSSGMLVCWSGPQGETGQQGGEGDRGRGRASGHQGQGAAHPRRAALRSQHRQPDQAVPQPLHAGQCKACNSQLFTI